MRAALYARVSTRDQHPEIQLEALRSYCERRGWTFEEFSDHGISGRQNKRPALDALMDSVKRREFDAVVIVKLDRLFRSTRHLSALGAELEALGVDLIVVDQSIDTSTPAGKLLFNVLGAIGEFEADLIKERTMAGLEAARRRGKRLGRPRKAFPRELVQRAKRLQVAGSSVRRIAGILGISKTMAHRILKAG